jgi:hypothetical protein
MTYTEIKQRIQDLLNLPVDEMLAMGYSAKIPRVVNECLQRIVNTAATNLRELTFTLSSDDFMAGKYRLTMPPDFMSFASEQDAYLNGDYFVLTKFIGSNSILLTGDETHKYSNAFEYTIFYNAFYPVISPDGKTFTHVQLIDSAPYFTTATESIDKFEVPDNVGTIIPHFVAGQLLASDDMVRSTTELNEFDIQLSNLDTSRNERQREYHSSRGWY